MKRKFKPRVRADADQEKYIEWCRAVKRRDRYKCQMPKCLYKGRILHSHHILRYVDAPGLRYTISNGITLCPACHKKITGHELTWASLFRMIIKKNAK